MLGARPTVRLERNTNVLAVAPTAERALPASVIKKTVQSAVLIKINFNSVLQMTRLTTGPTDACNR